MDEKNEIRRKICPICGLEFAPTSAAGKYCGDECRAKGRNLSRRSWEQRSGYLEKQRQHMREIRDKRTAEEKAEAERLERKKRITAKREATRKANKEKDQLLYRAELGDASAIYTLELRKQNNLTPEFWEAFKGYDLAYCESIEQRSITEVNGISIHNEQFGLAVSMSIDELKRITIRTGSERKGNDI